MSVVSKLVRVSRLSPGYDCIRQPCGKRGCGTDPGSSHGVHCDDWIYAVHDGQLALSLVVFSGVFPPTVPADTSGVFTWPKAAALMLCEKHHDEAEGESRECFFLGRCMIISDWCSYAQEVWRTCGGKTSYDQEEGFWRGLEAEFFDQQKRRMGVEYTRELGLS